MNFDILHIDEHIIVLNKPSGLLSVPGLYNKDSAFGRLAEVYGELHIVHRLDMDTSGIIVYARNKAALTAIQQQFEKQQTRKVYEAVLLGVLPGSYGCVNLPICVDWARRPLQQISHTQGRYALTRWKKMDVSNNRTRLELFPKTGRSHQLRIHMQQLGHPIVGDVFYAGEEAKQEKRLLLHARELDFRHPATGEAMEIICRPDF
ncbi:MAG: RNA pseudouridine synthase [Oceanospirillaceae bacterium]|uniref:RluA family pseudouridine synthase n=1 Tax=unclassified Thalassolituus TaxID=2624967 RepID=UPI000C09C64B|nr:MULTISPECIES: RluA family pseudouridine synthase [unclassified Thalassolituus]MAK91704.1 RNA pseudouridine synthase [Thalassolituus sp.]MAX99894.1 RNA pseudouridine synthase [Oceanospirillaceae bacterium]MBS53439.1 RNA pseudouridine synthase [Oceanospirillaceae bacterium]|tara:strand:- start:1014 stop:1628 length:615 start_codon:yes stop_codon:yes gene_type:complete